MFYNDKMIKLLYNKANFQKRKHQGFKPLEFGCALNWQGKVRLEDKKMLK